MQFLYLYLISHKSINVVTFLNKYLLIKQTELDDSDVEPTEEEESHVPNPNTPPCDSLFLNKEKADRLEAFLKSQYNRRIHEVHRTVLK